jgi:hypothetical protein
MSDATEPQRQDLEAIWEEALDGIDRLCDEASRTMPPITMPERVWRDWTPPWPDENPTLFVDHSETRGPSVEADRRALRRVGFRRRFLPFGAYRRHAGGSERRRHVDVEFHSEGDRLFVPYAVPPSHDVPALVDNRRAADLLEITCESWDAGDRWAQVALNRGSILVIYRWGPPAPHRRPSTLFARIPVVLRGPDGSFL